MRFWDSSGVVPLLVAQQRTRAMQALLATDPEMIVWWSTETECASAIARLERDGDLDSPAAFSAFSRLDGLKESWHEVQPAEAIRTVARRLLRVHNLRTAGAQQLAAALAVSEASPASLEMVCLDGGLAQAAQREGLSVVIGTGG